MVYCRAEDARVRTFVQPGTVCADLSVMAFLQCSRPNVSETVLSHRFRSLSLSSCTSAQMNHPSAELISSLCVIAEQRRSWYSDRNKARTKERNARLEHAAGRTNWGTTRGSMLPIFVVGLLASVGALTVCRNTLSRFGFAPLPSRASLLAPEYDPRSVLGTRTSVRVYNHQRCGRFPHGITLEFWSAQRSQILHNGRGLYRLNRSGCNGISNLTPP